MLRASAIGWRTTATSWRPGSAGTGTERLTLRTSADGRLLLRLRFTKLTPTEESHADRGEGTQPSGHRRDAGVRRAAVREDREAGLRARDARPGSGRRECAGEPDRG